jgi:hypothetical protein
MDSNDILEQGKRRRRIDARRKYFQEHRISIILKIVSITIAVLALSFGVAKYCGWLPPSYKVNSTTINDKPQTNSNNTTSKTVDKQ